MVYSALALSRVKWGIKRKFHDFKQVWYNRHGIHKLKVISWNQELQRKEIWTHSMYGKHLPEWPVADPGGGGAHQAHAPLLQPQNEFFQRFCIKKSSSGRSNHYVFGIIGKLLENAGEWWVFHGSIYSMHMLKSDQVSKGLPLLKNPRSTTVLSISNSQTGHYAWPNKWPKIPAC